MPDFLIRAVLPYASGIERDVAMNTFCVHSDGEASLEVLQVFAAFYTEGVSGERISDLLSPILDNSEDAARIEVAEIDLTTGHVSPTLTQWNFTLPGNASTSTSMPLECSIVMSYYSDEGSPVPIRRRRGRAFLGPLNVSCLHENDAGNVDNATCDFIAEKAIALRLGVLAEGGVWSIWSRAQEATYPVDSGWVDNEFDVQRRREINATYRATF